MKTLRAWPLAAALLSPLALAACASAPPPPPPPGLTVTDAQAGDVRLARGQELVIALPLNAGTGYGWRLDREAPAWLLSGGSSHTTDADQPGGAVRTIFTYKAVTRGSTDLAFTFKRAWEPDSPGDRKVVFHIWVR